MGLYGGKDKQTGGEIDINNAINLYIRMQKITQTLTEDQISQTHSTWGESFFFGLINALFLDDKGNRFNGFPLYDNEDFLFKVLKSITYWNKFNDEKITAKNIYNIINNKQNPISLDKEMIISLIVPEDIKSLQKRYPKVSKNDIIALIIRYGSPESNPYFKEPIKLSSAYLSLPPPVYKYMAEILYNPVEAFAGPINCTLPIFCSVFKEDKPFGSLGPFIPEVVKNSKNKTFICNPPYDTVSLQICANSIAAGIGICNQFTNILPAKDGNLFHMYGERYLKKHHVYTHSRLNSNKEQQKKSNYE